MTQNTNQLIQEMMESYYEYVVKIEDGCTSIIESINADNVQIAMRGIIALSEGLEWLTNVETLLKEHSFKINSPVLQISPLFKKINGAIGRNDFNKVKDLLELELKSLFADANMWKFEEVLS